MNAGYITLNTVAVYLHHKSVLIQRRCSSVRQSTTRTVQTSGILNNTTHLVNRTDLLQLFVCLDDI